MQLLLLLWHRRFDNLFCRYFFFKQEGLVVVIAFYIDVAHLAFDDPDLKDVIGKLLRRQVCA